jgi:arylsulfate sulfotransferase
MGLLMQGCGAHTSSSPAANPASSSCVTPVASALSGGVATTANPQVARYTFSAPGPGTVYVRFGTSQDYGLATVPVRSNGGSVTLLVAGMLPKTTYHMQAVFSDGSSEMKDADQTFQTGGPPCQCTAQLSASTQSGTPQPGVEMLAGGNSGGLPIPVVTDLKGNIIWSYLFPDEAAGVSAYPVRLLSNGNLLMLISHNSSALLKNTTGVDPNSSLRVINLAGDTIQDLSITDLNSRLAAKGYKLKLGGFSHDVIALPNGHLVVNATTEKSLVLSGDTSATLVLGDALVDLDTNLQPVWAWNTFDHLDVNRHPFNFPDWTHANAVSYVPADGSLLYSMRHQNWVVKIHYGNGAGDGSIDWRLGPGGDFTLLNADGSVDSKPEDWFYSQHAAEYLAGDASSSMTIALMDNGDDRQFASGSTCPVTAGSYCYTTIPVLRLDQQKMTAQFLFRQTLPTALYSFWGGNTNLLANGHIQYELSGLDASKNSAVYEVTNEPSPHTVWSLKITGGVAYRGERWPSLYPGVQW